MRHLRYLLSSLLVVGLGSACDLPDVTIEGTHVRIAADPGLELCAGSLAQMDDFIVRVSMEFGVDPPTGNERFLFYWLDEDGFYERSHCTAGHPGCERDGIIYSMSAPLNHEFVHMASHAFQHGPPFFNEGLAEAYEGLGSVRQAPTVRADDIGRSLYAERSHFVDYDAAAVFTSFLIARHGLDKYLAAYAALPREPSAESIDKVFREILEVSLEQSITEFEATYRPCSEAENDAKLIECAAPELTWDGSVLVHFRRLACGQEDAVGPYSGEALVVFRTIVIPSSGLYKVKVIGDMPGGAEEREGAISLVPCGGCGTGPSAVVPAGGDGATLSLTAGRHSLRFHGSSKISTGIGLRIEPAFIDW